MSTVQYSGHGIYPRKVSDFELIHRVIVEVAKYNTFTGLPSILSISVYENVIAKLFGPRPRDELERPGRKYKYSVDIKTEQESTFTFDVPSMNPFDAYVQLTKRIAYKTIPGIVSALVFAGLQSERQPSAKPLRTFEHDGPAGAFERKPTVLNPATTS